MLCDLSKVHTGYIIIPKVTHVTEDREWGQPGSSKKIYVSETLIQKSGFAFIDRVIERKENEYWKIQIDTFQHWQWGIDKMVGEWRTKSLGRSRVLVEYSYKLHFSNPLFFPFVLIMGHTVWKFYMKKVMENVKKMAYANEPYLYD